MSLTQLQQLENTWEAEINKGNDMFQSSEFTEACSSYLQAVIASEVLMENLTTAFQHFLRVPGMYYVACVNLARNYWGMQDVTNAATYFLYCTYKLKMFSDKPHAALLLKHAATIYWLKSVEAYKAFADKTGTPMPIDLHENETYEQLKNLKNLFNLPKEQMN